jgi:hypothetical protein
VFCYAQIVEPGQIAGCVEKKEESKCFCYREVIPSFVATYPTLGHKTCSLLSTLLSSFQPTKENHMIVSRQNSEGFLKYIKSEMIRPYKLH